MYKRKINRINIIKIFSALMFAFVLSSCASVEKSNENQSNDIIKNLQADQNNNSFEEKANEYASLLGDQKSSTIENSDSSYQESNDINEIGQREVIKELSPPPKFRYRKELIAETDIEIKTQDVKSILENDEVIDVVISSQSIPNFIDTVYGVLLSLNYVMSKDVSNLKDFITLRGNAGTKKSDLFFIASQSLLQYGIKTTIEDGVVFFEKSDDNNDIVPIFLTSTNNQSVPETERPIIYYYEFKFLSANSIDTVFESSFPNKKNITFKNIRANNTMIITGEASYVRQAVAMAEKIDQPYFANGKIAQIDPLYWSAKDLGKELVNVLSIEGIQALNITGGDLKRAVMVVPIEKINRLLIFSNYDLPFKRALYWVEQLDSPSNFGDKEAIFIYNVQNTDAASISELLSSLLKKSTQTQSGSNATNNDLSISPSQISADLAGNRILFRGSASEFEIMRSLLAKIDSPPPQVLLEVTIAELTLDDELGYGFDFFVNEVVNSGTTNSQTTTYQTEGNVGLGGTGLVVNLTSNDIRARLNAFAGNRRVNILSTPRIVARSGGEAYFQVGQEVPVVVTQSATPISQDGQTTDVLQTISYRKTGIILTVTPVVFGEKKVDLYISQEVSSTNTNLNTTSPTISNRTIVSQMTVNEGTTAVLGGLMQNQLSNEELGVAFLKDIPIIGNLFKSKKTAESKTELMIFVTAYILDEEDENAKIANEFLSLFDENGYESIHKTYTLSPRRDSPLSGIK